MGTFTVDGVKFTSEGERPSIEELQSARNFLKTKRQRESAAMPPSPGGEAPPPPGPVVPPPDPGAPRVAELETGSDMQVPGTEVARTVARAGVP